MDSHASSECMSEEGEAVLLHENAEPSSMNFLQDDPKQEENGHINISSCNFVECESSGGGGGGGGGDCGGAAAAAEIGSSIDIMMPTLEEEEGGGGGGGRGRGREHAEEENCNSMVADKSSKHDLYLYKMKNENHPNDGEKQFESSEISEDHDKILQLSNIQVINVLMEKESSQNQDHHEMEENDEINVHQNQVIVETLHFDETNIANESINANDEENLDSQVDDQDQDEETDGASHDQYDESSFKKSISDHVVYETFIDDKSTESLQQNVSITQCQLNDNYTHEANPPTEIQLSNETEDISSDQHSDVTQATYEIYSHLSDSNAIPNKENNEMHLITNVYRQKNIINIAAASANIDIDESNEMIKEQQEGNQTSLVEENFSSIQSSADIEICQDTHDELIANHDGQIIMIQKEEESASEVIEEIYFIQDVVSCSDDNYQQDKNTSNSDENIHENEEEEEGQEMEEGEEGNIEEEEEEDDENDDNYFKKSDNSAVKKSSTTAKSRNVIQDIFDDWRDENADEDNEILSSNDTVEIELNNLLNDEIKKKPVISKEMNQQKNLDNDGVILSNDKTNAENPKETRITGEIKAVSSTCSKSSSSSSSSTKKQTKNSTQDKDIPSYVQPYVRGTYSTSDSSTTFPAEEATCDLKNPKKKLQSPRLGVKVPSRHLKSQIATPAQVTEVLKERLREKQKDLESPQAADIVFVKKLTQRFASKICAGGPMPVPALIPIQQSRAISDGFANSNTTNLNDNPDNRELLAILEGDVDPDWSNLKPAATDDDDTTSVDSNTSKLNSAAQRELALKQLLEMPSTGRKRREKKSFNIDNEDVQVEQVEKSPKTVRECEEQVSMEKPKEVNLSKKVTTNKQKRISSLASSTSSSSSSSSTETKISRTRSLSPIGKLLKENDSQNTPLTKESTTLHVEFGRIDETRSGRKRKPTEKALEQFASKRQKKEKTKSPHKMDIQSETAAAAAAAAAAATTTATTTTVTKTTNQILEDAHPNKKKKSDINSKQDLNCDAPISTSSPSSSSPPPPPPSTSTSKETTNKKGIESINNAKLTSTSSKTTTPTGTKSDKNSKTTTSLIKKERIIATSIHETRGKVTSSVRKRLLSPRRTPTTAKTTTTTTTLARKQTHFTNVQNNTTPLLKRRVGRPPKIVQSPVLVKEKLSTEKIETSKPKRKRKTGIKEIDKLLQDEGVVNLLYDVGQPRKRRLIPITKSHKKIMDIEKAERDLNLRKKLVKSTVLGMQNSNVFSDKIAYRTKRRTSPHENIHTEETLTSATEKRKNSIENKHEFIYPAKIRNAADASVIVRRHSSSSFSSVSGSPRVSIDSPLEVGTDVGVGGGRQTNDETNHGLRSTTKRKQSSSSSSTADNTRHNILQVKRNKQSKTTESTKSISMVESKDKTESTKKENKIEIDERNNKKTNKTTSLLNLKQDNSEKTDKVTTRSNKEKSHSVTTNNSNTTDATTTTTTSLSTKNQDKLSACLAEAATALSSVGSNSNTISNTQGQVELDKPSTAVGRKNKAMTNDVKKQGYRSTTNDSNNDNSSNNPGTHDKKEINVCRHGNLVQLILSPSSTKMVNGITLKVMQELCDILSILKTDDECRVVLFTSNGSTSFCEGLDLSTLLHTNKEKRKVCAQQVANSVKEFIKCLATFNKPLVAGVQGAAVGLGVTILPLFDLVIASDKATFYTPYGKLGQIPEGAAIMTLSHVHGSAVASELLLGGRTLTASEALRAGLVTRVLWPERFPLELLPLVKAMSEQSSQSMEATKALLRTSLRNKLNAALDSETHILVKQWCSDECQIAIKKHTMKQIE